MPVWMLPIREPQRARHSGRLAQPPFCRRLYRVFMSLAFILAAAQLNRETLLLSPVVLAVLLLYSYTKRFTRWSHLVLGLALGIAPAAAWIAIRGRWIRASSCSPRRFFLGGRI
jgi:4-hydroxybenzoate polyprenyltransferase